MRWRTTRRTLADVSMQTSPDNPAPLHRISAAISDWIDRLGAVWVEGQVTEIRRRPGASQVYLQLRDVEQKASVTVVTSPATLAGVEPPIADGSRIVMHAKAEFWNNQGRLVLRAREIRAVGLGDLLARIERLKVQLAAEGLFAEQRKQPLPFLPRRVGLICGRGSAAERDVVENARRRWPAVVFETREVAVQGATAAAAVTTALIELDAITEVDVIVITRGGGSVEDLLAFSDEALIRAVSECRTPVVSAIGHEQDTPLLDHVADVRASTPTDAARRVVPDLGEQTKLVGDLRRRALRAIAGRLDSESHRIDRLAAHPGLAEPTQTLDRAMNDLVAQRDRCARSLLYQLQTATAKASSLRSQLNSLSPAATLERGYAIVTDAKRSPVSDLGCLSAGQPLSVRVAAGTFDAFVADPPNAKRQP